jgi:[acyl-carrier-protein] S-malonyltransferase
MAKTAFLFAGQGAQAVGMGRGICEQSAAAKALFERASHALGYDLAAVCFEGPADRLNTTVVSQPAIFVTSLAAIEWLRQQEPELIDQCQGTAGLSLGEYTALAFAGAFGFDEGLALVNLRGQAMQVASEAVPSGMLAILTLDLPAVEAICAEAQAHGLIRVANYLCPGNTVVSGEAAAIEAAEALAKARGATAVRLSVAGAFHTPLMAPARAQLQSKLEQTTINPPRLPVWSNVDAAPHTDPQPIRDLLIRQVTEPVRWESIIRGMLADGFDRFVEVGPGRVLAGLLKRIDRKVEVRNVNALDR